MKQFLFTLTLLLALTSPQSLRACPLALILAIDASASVDEAEYALQMGGLATAFLDPEVQAAGIALGGLYLSAYEWSGRPQQAMIAEWRYVKDQADFLQLAQIFAAHKRSFEGFPTAMGYGLSYGALLMDRLPQPCSRKIIDVSGDGVHNDGYPPRSAYKYFNFRDVTVNGLVIKGADPDPEGYYLTEVLYGPGSFLEIAQDYSDFARAMRFKLIREIGGAIIGEADPGPNREQLSLSQ